VTVVAAFNAVFQHCLEKYSEYNPAEVQIVYLQKTSLECPTPLFRSIYIFVCSISKLFRNWFKIYLFRLWLRLRTGRWGEYLDLRAMEWQVTGNWRKLHNEELHTLYSSRHIIRMINSRRMRWAGNVARRDMGNAYFVWQDWRGDNAEDLGMKWEDNIKIDLRELGWEGVC
jgi:hypothetical protein